MSSGGRAASSSECVTSPKAREIGLTGCIVPIQYSLLIGRYVMAMAEHREPCDSRGSCTVLGAPEGEIPPGDSTTAVFKRCPRKVRYHPERTFRHFAFVPLGDQVHRNKIPCGHTCADRFHNGRCGCYMLAWDSARGEVSDFRDGTPSPKLGCHGFLKQGFRFYLRPIRQHPPWRVPNHRPR